MNARPLGATGQASGWSSPSGTTSTPRPAGGDPRGSGDSDDDWYGSFHQRYRYAVARVPVCPAVGNHDSADQEFSDDRSRVRADFHTDARVTPGVTGPHASLAPGMVYRLAFGADVEFVCLDTSLSRDLRTAPFFEHPRRRRSPHTSTTSSSPG